MKFSLKIPVPDEGEAFANPAVLAELAQSIERAGIDSCWLTDHPFPKVGIPKTGHQAHDIFVLSSILLSATETLTVQLNVLVMAYRNPFLAARAIATLDRFAPGRLHVGIGSGYMKAEFAALGADFIERGRLVEPGVDAMLAAWSGEPVHLDAADWRADGNVMSPRPATTPRPSLWRGGNSRNAIRSAVGKFDGWAPFETFGDHAARTTTAPLNSPELMAARIAYVKGQCEIIGRSRPPEVCFVRQNPAWTTGDDNTVVSEIASYAEAGADWLALALPAPSIEAFADRITWFGELTKARSAS
jgi:alkanesulfonate monooxygenase SsuD/methylene tetrahydromethanopterin reductase-like flavin-dependent oxidoreductase (luciferase family)